MIIFHEGYRYIRTKYIVPLAQYSVTYPKAKKNSIKDLLYKGSYHTVYKDNSDFCFEFPEADLLKAQLCDIWLFYIKSVLQYDAALKIYSIPKDFCPNWTIVTDYYTAFFDACTILRLVGKGNSYFNDDIIKKISSDISFILRCPESITNNMVYAIKKNPTNGLYILQLHKSTKKTHQTLWIEISNLINEMRSNALPDTAQYHEKEVLDLLSIAINKLGASFPATLRNNVNYQPLYATKAIEHTIHASQAYKSTDDWLSALYRYSGEQDDSSRVDIFKCYAYYLHTLKINLINEYYDLQNGKGCGIYAAINKHRDSPLSLPPPNYSY